MKNDFQYNSQQRKINYQKHYRSRLRTVHETTNQLIKTECGTKINYNLIYLVGLLFE